MGENGELTQEERNKFCRHILQTAAEISEIEAKLEALSTKKPGEFTSGELVTDRNGFVRSGDSPTSQIETLIKAAKIMRLLDAKFDFSKHLKEFSKHLK